MRVLMVAPHPVYTPRGTPISVLNRCRALCALGHEVDLVTYPIGEDVAVDGLRYLRSACPPGLRRVRVGFSPAKVVLDAGVALSALGRAWHSRRGPSGASHGGPGASPGASRVLSPAAPARYDVVHTHEEAGLIGPLIARLLGVPHVYDMGNDWTAVLENYGLSPTHPLVRLAHSAELAVVRRSACVIAHFPSIAAALRAESATPVHVAFNVPLDPEPGPDAVATARRRYAPGGDELLVYTGTLEPYQGVEALIEATEILRRCRPRLRLVVAGGDAERIAALESHAAKRRLSGVVLFAGRLDPLDADALVRCADVAVSPRRAGSNTPLKIFSYLRAGTPIVASDTAAHRQVLDDTCAVLAAAEGGALAAAIESVLADPLRAASLRQAARQLARRYGPEGYLGALARAYEHAGARPAAPEDIAAAARRLAPAAAGAATFAQRRAHPARHLVAAAAVSGHVQGRSFDA